MASRASADHDAAMRTALRLLSYRARSRQELVARLRRRGFDAGLVSRVLDDLATRGLVDDRVFAFERVRTRVLNRHLGPRRLTAELRDTGVDEDIVKAAVREVFQEISEDEVARAAAMKRIRALGSLSRTLVRRRLTGYLQRQGFSSETIHRVVAALLKHDS